MDIDVASLIDLYVFPTKVRLFTLSVVHDKARAMGLTMVAERAAAAIEHDQHTHELELRRRAARNKRLYGDEAPALSKQMLRTMTGLAGYLDAQMRLYTVDSEAGAAARELRQALLPQGVRPLTKLSYVEQCEAIGVMIKRLDDGDLVHLVAALPGLPAHVEHVRELNAQFAACLNDRSHRGPSAAEVREAQSRGQELLAGVVVLILGEHVAHGRTAEASELLQVVLQQNRSVGKAKLRRQRAGKAQKSARMQGREPATEAAPDSRRDPAAPHDAPASASSTAS